MLTLFFKATTVLERVGAGVRSSTHHKWEMSFFFLSECRCLYESWMNGIQMSVISASSSLNLPSALAIHQEDMCGEEWQTWGGGTHASIRPWRFARRHKWGGKKTSRHFSEISSRCFHITGCKRSRWNTDSPLCVSLSLCPHNSFPLSSLFFSFCLCDYTDNILLLSLNIVTFICMYVYIYMWILFTYLNF